MVRVHQGLPFLEEIIMKYWIIEAVPQHDQVDGAEASIVWDKYGTDPARAVREAKRLAQGVLRPRGTLVHWASYGPFETNHDKLFEDGVI